MNIEIGPTLAAILGPLVAVVVLWVKSSIEHDITNTNIDALHDKVDALAAPAPVSSVNSHPPPPPPAG